MKFFTKVFAASLCATAFMAFVPAASAAQVQQITMKLDGVNPGVGATVWTGSEDVSTIAGGQQWTVTKPDADGDGTSVLGSITSLLAWCVELTQGVSIGGTYTYDVDTNPTLGWVNSVERLFTAHSAVVNTAAGSAAMQMAIWELVTGQTDNNVSVGNAFHASGSSATFNTAANTANGWLQDLATSTGDRSVGWKVVLLTNENAQNLITFQEVIATPLPGAALMFLSALGLGGLARRKSKADPQALAA